MAACFVRLVIVAALVFGSAAAAPVQEERPPRLTISGDMKRPAQLTHVSPAYPEEAKPAEGTVLLDIVIATDGTVSEIEVARGVHNLLDDAAVAAVRKWKYVPTTMDGEPVEVAMIVPITFMAPQ